MNKVILIGRLAADPETRTTSGGNSVCTFRLAVQRRHKNQDGTRTADFLTVIAWRQLADLCARYLSKGRQCAVVGQIQTRTYDAQDGSKRYVTEIIADEVEFLGSAEGAGSGGAQATQQTQPPEGFTEIDMDDDELPF